jgi:aspartate aminotransferase
VLSPEQFEKAITPKTRLLMLNSPSNPTGAVYPVAALEALARVAVKHQIPVLSDEIYEKLIYGSSEFRSFASFGEDVQKLTIIVSGVSKAYAMTGWRIGWSIAPVELTKVIDNLQSQQTSNPCSISQYAAIAGLTGPQDSVAAMHAEFIKRREYVLDRFRKIPNVKFVEPGGAFYIFFDVSHYFGKTLQGDKVVDNATDFCTALLETAHVALVTGDAFGAPGFVRLSFATNIETLGQGIDRIAGFLNPA